MSQQRITLSQTQEIPAWKVSVTKIKKKSESAQKGSLVGWEYAAPEKGYPYLVYLRNRSIFRTSPVQEVRETDHGVILKTVNSTYLVKYLGMGYFTEDPGE